MSIHQFDEYLALVEKTRRSWQGQLDVRLGLENDYMPGMETWLADLHAKASFDYLLGSIHPHLPEYRSAYMVGEDIPAYQRTYFDLLAQAAESGLFDAISHPDYIKSVWPKAWHLKPLRDDIRRSLDRIAQTGVALEVNTAGTNKAPGEMYPGRWMLKEMRMRDIPVVLGSDAHHPEQVGQKFGQALEELAGAGYTQVRFFLERRPRDITISGVADKIETVVSHL